MERHLSLIKTDYQEVEKRVFPRFPFGFMFFKDTTQTKKVFEVKDISLTGMQMSFKDGDHGFAKGSVINGELVWREAKINVKATVMWVRENSLGLSFETGIYTEEKLRNFLCFDNIVSHIKPLHNTNLEIDLPNNLKYWLKSDGVLDLFVWEHPKHGISRFQVLVMEHFIEWEEGLGVKSGKALTQRNLETPLSQENEFVFEIDEALNANKVDMAIGVVEKINGDILPNEAREFILYKLRN